LEIDRAFKSKDTNLGFRVHVITRCIDPDNADDQHLAGHFMNITYEKQRKRDEDNRQKVGQRMRRLGIMAADDRTSVCGADSPSPGSSAEDVAASQGEGCLPLDDAPMQDPHLRKYFFRQRTDSRSRYPRIDYKCPLLCYRGENASITDRPSFDEVDDDPLHAEDLMDEEELEEGTAVPSMEQSTHTIGTDRPPTAGSTLSSSRHNSSSASALTGLQHKKKSLSVSTASEERGGEGFATALRHHPSDCSWQSSSESSSSSQSGEPASTDDNDTPVAVSSSAPSFR